MGTVLGRMEVFKQMMLSVDTAYLTEYTLSFDIVFSTAPNIDILAALMAVDVDLEEHAVGINEQHKEELIARLTAPRSIWMPLISCGYRMYGRSTGG